MWISWNNLTLPHSSFLNLTAFGGSLELLRSTWICTLTGVHIGVGWNNSILLLILLLLLPIRIETVLCYIQYVLYWSKLFQLQNASSLLWSLGRGDNSIHYFKRNPYQIISNNTCIIMMKIAWKSKFIAYPSANQKNILRIAEIIRIAHT